MDGWVTNQLVLLVLVVHTMGCIEPGNTAYSVHSDTVRTQI
jgi:hypothetical protein